MISILIVDDQKTSQQFLKVSLEKEEDFSIIGLANNGKEAIEKTAEFQPNIIIMDINMPVMDGLSATRIISERYQSTKVLIFSLYDDDESLSNAIEAGAKGYLFKNTPPEEMILAIRSAHQGYFQLGPGLLERYLYRFSINALSNKDISYKMSKAADAIDKNQNFSFLIDKILNDITKLEKNMILNRSLLYFLLLFNLFSLFLVIIFKA